MRKIILLFIISFSALYHSYGQTYNEVVERAMKCALGDSLVQAEQLFRQALKMDPNNARNALLFSNLGTVLKRMGRTDEAIEAYTMALNITPYSTAMLLNRGTLYLDKGLDSKAYVDFCNVIDLIPENIEARLYRAYIYMQRREYKEARIDYNVIVGKEPSHKAARIGLAMLDQLEGNLTAARDKLNLLIGEFSDDASLLVMRANLDLDRGYPESAVLDLEEALRVNPDDAETTVHLGDVYLSLKQKGKALNAYEKAISLGIPRSALMEQIKKCK